MVVAVAAVAGAAGQPGPTFPAKVEIVTVDAVVVDAQGRPVSGLTRDDFVVEEDGRPQEIVSFEAFVAEPSAPEPPRPAALASNEGEPPASARAFALVVDDAGITSREAVEARRAVGAFLDRSVREGDEVTLATTTGDAWWSARLPEGGQDLQAVLARLKGRAADPSLSFDAMTDYEAFLITNREPAGGGSGPVLQRVVARWLQNQACISASGGQRVPESCLQMVRTRAASLDAQRQARVRGVLDTVRRGLLALGPVRGRKSLLLFSHGFLEDSGPDARRVVAASREANTAVYFVSVRGLVSQPGTQSVSDATGTPDPSLFGTMSFEDAVLDSAGTRTLADDSGGFSVVDTDPAAGAARIAAESRVFYMLGFPAPPGKPPGEWRKLQVRVKREGLTVRARRGYTLQAAAEAAARSGAGKAGGGKGGPGKETRKLAPAVESALDSVHDAVDIPLRAIAYVFEPRPKDTARVLIAAEFDTGHLHFEGSGDARAARLEVTVAVTERETGKTLFADERVEVRAPEGTAPGWRSVAREFDLPAGVAQARLVVRDSATGALGAVAQRFEVPRAGALRLSTPVVTDQVVRPPGNDGKPRAALAAHRVFKPAGALYCEFEVFGATRDRSGAPNVTSALEVRSAEGAIVRQAPPSRIAADQDGRVVRLIGLGLDGMADGDYELVLDVRDEAGGGHLQQREPFTISTPSR